MLLSRHRWLGMAVAAALGGPAAAAPPARVVVDRIVAIVDSSVVTQRDVDRRTPSEARQLPADQLAKARAEIVTGIIDDILVGAEADRRHITVEPSDIEDALSAVANGAGLTVPQLLEEAAKQGFDAPTYRKELGRQILIMRTAQLWAAEEVSQDPHAAGAGDLGAAHKRLVAELRKRAYIEVRP
jgi:parvulin-like peptidyl-prolyl isomerase